MVNTTSARLSAFDSANDCVPVTSTTLSEVILDVSLVPLQVHYYTEELMTTALILSQS